MTKRARWYLAAAALRNGLLGVFLLVFPWLFSSAAFIPLFNLIPLLGWGIVMTADGLICAIAAYSRGRATARLGIAVSAVITLILAAGLVFGVVDVWASWVKIVGWHEVWYLVGNPPIALPARLLLLAPSPPSPFLPIVMLALTVKDFAVCAQPLRSPFEESRASQARPI